jgi:ribA/ribD-fused uncharacterized protein
VGRRDDCLQRSAAVVQALRSASEVDRMSTHPKEIVCHGLDTPDRVHFYEHEFYVLSNFSAFMVEWATLLFPTVEHAYHWAKFPLDPTKQAALRHASSAHLALEMARRWQQYRREDWDAVKVDIMRDILRCKVEQHEYVRRKLLETGDRLLVEDSWRDDFWGWGPNRDGQNVMGKLWMQIRAELREHGKVQHER